MATVAKDFKVKNGLIVEGATGTINGSNILTEASTEFLQDTVAGMVDGVHTNLTVSYNDTTGKLTFTAENGVADSTTTDLAEGTNLYFTDERVDDRVANLIVDGTGLDKAYNDGAGTLTLSIDSTVTTNDGTQTLTNKTISGSNNTLSNIGNDSLTNSAITINGTSVSLGGTRTLGTDDVAEGTTNKYFTDERAQDAIGTAIANGSQTNITVTYDDNTNSLSFNASGGVSSLTGTANEVEVSTSTGAVTIGLPDNVTIGNNLTVTGDLTVNGTTTTINSATVSVDDKNIELASTASPTDASADGAGLTVKGTTDKTWNWLDATDSWTSSEHINLASGKEYKVNGTSLKDTTETLTNKTISGSNNTLSNIGNDSLTNSAITINGTPVSLGGTRTLGTDDVAEGSTNKYFTDERAQDAIASAIAAGTHSNITITYDDETNKFTFAAENGVADSTTDNLAEGSTNLYFTNERAEDAVGGMVTGNTETGISVTYDDGTGKLNFSVDDQFPSKSTTNLAEGTNLYFTNARAVTALESVVPNFTEIDIASVVTQVAATTSVATASQVTAYQFAKADYRSAKFLVKAETATHTELSEVLVTLDASDNVSITEYAMVGTNGNLVDVTADVSGANVRLRVTTINNSTDVTVAGTLIA